MYPETHMIKNRMKGCLMSATARLLHQYLFQLSRSGTFFHQPTFWKSNSVGIDSENSQSLACVLTESLYCAQSKTSDKNRHKKPKDVKPKVKKLKYHQYIPPDQKAEKSPPPMDSAYARLLQQQQLFLQLQILSQQKHAQAHQSQQHTQASSHNQPHAQQRQPAFSYQPHPQSQTQKYVTVYDW